MPERGTKRRVKLEPHWLCSTFKMETGSCSWAQGGLESMGDWNAPYCPGSGPWGLTPQRSKWGIRGGRRQGEVGNSCKCKPGNNLSIAHLQARQPSGRLLPLPGLSQRCMKDCTPPTKAQTSLASPPLLCLGQERELLPNTINRHLRVMIPTERNIMARNHVVGLTD